MATTVGAAVLSDELVVAQSDKIALGTEVETLVIEFDQSKYEEFLSSRASSPVEARKCRRVSYETSAPVASAESSRAILEKESPTTSRQAKKWVVKPTSETISRISASADEPRQTKAGPVNGPLSRRARQRQRQNQARRKAGALVSFDGFHYRPRSDQPRHDESKERHRNDDTPSRTQDDEPRSTDEPRQEDEPRRPDEPRPRPQIVSRGYRHKNDFRPKVEPRRQNWTKAQPRRRRQPRQIDEPRPNDEPRRMGEPRMRTKPRQAYMPRQPRKFHFCETKSTEDTTDLHDYPTRKRSVEQMQSHCCCEKLISAMMAQCPSTHQPTVFERLSKPSNGRRRFCRKNQATRNHCYPGVTINMVGRGGSKEDSSESSDPEFSPGLREALFDGQGVYQRTRSRTGVVIPFNYQRLASLSGGTDEEPENSCMATSQPSNTDLSEQVSVHMIEKEMARRIEEQQATILAQKESIRRLKEMLEQLLSEKKKKKRRTSRALRSSSKHKERVPTPPHTSSESSSQSSGGTSSLGHNPRDKRFDELQSQLNALKLQKHMNKLGVVRPYPTEWDTVSYPAKFEPPDLLQFDGKGSPTQHIYYFQAQTGHIMGNDPIMTRLFIGTLKGVAFEWFRRLEPESITCWKDMERLFMARFFDDDIGVSVTTLLAAKQRETESVSNFVRRFRNQSLRARDQISEVTLIEMCRNNLSIDILSNMGAVKTHSWKDLTRQGEQVESVLERMKVEELFEFRGGDDQDTLVVATASSSKLLASSELANSEPSYGTDGEDLATIGQR